jgi:hypothetical protein
MTEPEALQPLHKTSPDAGIFLKRSMHYNLQRFSLKPKFLFFTIMIIPGKNDRAKFYPKFLIPLQVFGDRR